MAKITHRGMWIKISSLNPEDKKNYLTSMALFMIGAFAWSRYERRSFLFQFVVQAFCNDF